MKYMKYILVYVFDMIGFPAMNIGTITILWYCNFSIQYILVQHISKEIQLKVYKNSNININKETECYNYTTIYINKKTLSLDVWLVSKNEFRSCFYAVLGGILECETF